MITSSCCFLKGSEKGEDDEKITARFISAIVGALFFFSLAIAIMGIIAARENRLVSVFGYSFAAVATDSMTPTIDPQDIVIARKAAFETIEEDDIIIFTPNLTAPISYTGSWRSRRKGN